MELPEHALISRDKGINRSLFCAIKWVNRPLGGGLTALLSMANSLLFFSTYERMKQQADYINHSKLSYSQVIIVSLVNIFSAIAWGLESITHAHAFEILVAAHTKFAPPFWELLGSMLAGTTWFTYLIAGLYFRHDARSNSVKN